MSSLPHDAAIEHRDWPYQWQQPFLEAFAREANATQAARYAGISRQRAYQVIHDDPDFRAAYEAVKPVGNESAEHILFVRGTTGELRRKTRTTERRRFEVLEGGTRKLIEEEEVVVTEEGVVVETRALIEFLRANSPKYQPRVEHTGPEGGPIPMEHRVMRDLNPERLPALLVAMRELAEEHGVIEGTARELPPAD